MKQVLFLIFLTVFCSPLLTFGMERFDIVTTQELSSLLAERQKGETDFVLVNTLDEILFRDKAIPGSISVPWSRVKTAYTRLGNDKDKLVITYCMGYR